MKFNRGHEIIGFQQGIFSDIIEVPRDLGRLQRDYTSCPYSVWPTQSKVWQQRKRMWIRKGIRSELGRKEGITYGVPKKMGDGKVGSGFDIETSVFDPVICETCYVWWCPEGGTVIDPFAGGSVRGLMASMFGLKYWGCELRAEQVTSNREQVHKGNTGRYKPKWVIGDSNKMLKNAPMADFMLTCPPYGNLEVYSQEPGDISRLDYREFLDSYAEIMNKALRKLKENRFCVVVVSNYRDTATREFRNLVGNTTDIMQLSGQHVKLYNDIVLYNAIGTAGIRTSTTFIRGKRKIVRCHQNVLVFVKGDPEAASDFITNHAKEREC